MCLCFSNRHAFGELPLLRSGPYLFSFSSLLFFVVIQLSWMQQAAHTHNPLQKNIKMKNKTKRNDFTTHTDCCRCRLREAAKKRVKKKEIQMRPSIEYLRYIRPTQNTIHLQTQTNKKYAHRHVVNERRRKKTSSASDRISRTTKWDIKMK